MNRCVRAWIWLLIIILGGCVQNERRLAEPDYDPLPALFPVQMDYPHEIAGWTMFAGTEHGHSAQGLRLEYAGPAPVQPRVVVEVRFADAYVDGYEALSDQWPVLVAGIDQTLAAESLSIMASQSDRTRSIRPAADGLPERVGRALRLQVRAADGAQSLLVAELYFVDPYIVSLHSLIPAQDADNDHSQAALSRAVDDFGAALIAALQPSPAVLCDPRVQVLKVREGLSNVSSNGRVIFISTATDHVDASTVAELRRAAARQRERSGCPPQAQDFSTLEAQMRRRARVL